MVWLSTSKQTEICLAAFDSLKIKLIERRQGVFYAEKCDSINQILLNGRFHYQDLMFDLVRDTMTVEVLPNVRCGKIKQDYFSEEINRMFWDTYPHPNYLEMYGQNDVLAWHLTLTFELHLLWVERDTVMRQKIGKMKIKMQRCETLDSYVSFVEDGGVCRQSICGIFGLEVTIDGR